MPTITAHDLAILTAIGRAGTFTAAARVLGVAHTTVSRKLQELEEHYGTRLVERVGDRVVLTAEGERAARSAGRIEEELLELERGIKGRDGRLSGHIALTTVDILAWRYLDRFKSICEHYPDIEITLSTETEVKSLSRREAEMALRLTNAPEDYLYGRAIEQFVFAPYARKDVANAIAKAADICSTPWLAYAARECAALSAGWMKRHASHARVCMQMATPLLMLRAIQRGIGVGLLPTVVADECGDLVRVTDVPAFCLDVWLLAPAELKHTARIRAVFEAFGNKKPVV